MSAVMNFIMRKPSRFSFLSVIQFKIIFHVLTEDSFPLTNPSHVSLMRNFLPVFSLTKHEPLTNISASCHDRSLSLCSLKWLQFRVIIAALISSTTNHIMLLSHCIHRIKIYIYVDINVITPYLYYCVVQVTIIIGNNFCNVLYIYRSTLPLIIQDNIFTDMTIYRVKYGNLKCDRVSIYIDVYLSVKININLSVIFDIVATYFY